MRQHLVILVLLTSLYTSGQAKRERIVVDGNKKFSYSDSFGVTSSYIQYFGDSFPVPNLTTIDGQSIFNSDAKRKTVIYNFWFVACRPCVAEIPALNRLANKYQSDSIVFIAITFDPDTRIKAFLQNHPFNFQIVSLQQGEIDRIKKVAFYPFTAIVTKDGKLSFALFSRPVGKKSG